VTAPPGNRNDNFARYIFGCLKQVFADPEIKGYGFKLAFAISQHINRSTRKTFVAQKTLAKEIGLSERATRTLLDLLRLRGHVEVDTKHGPDMASEYRMIFDNRKPTSAIGRQEPEASFRFEGGNTGSLAHEYRKPDDSNTGSQLPPYHLREPLREPLSKNQTQESELFTDASSQNLIPNDLTAERPLRGLPRRKNLKASAVTIDAAFDCFWAAYPKRVAKGAARKAFAAAIKAGTDPEAIIEGARRFCTERIGADPRYTAHPATWLNGERWTDESAVRPNGSGPVTLDNETGRPIEPQHHAEGDRNYRTAGRPATFSEIAAQREMERRRGRG
jgi:hypothetical protein